MVLIWAVRVGGWGLLIFSSSRWTSFPLLRPVHVLIGSSAVNVPRALRFFMRAADAFPVLASVFGRALQSRGLFSWKASTCCLNHMALKPVMWVPGS